MQYVNGGWSARTEIPADQASIGAGSAMYNRTQQQLRIVISDASPESQVGALYRSFTDESAIEQLDAAPIALRLARLSAITDKNAFTCTMREAKGTHGASLVDLLILANPLNATKSIVAMLQAPLGLPNRDYYLEKKFSEERQGYRDYVERLLAMIDYQSPTEAADAVVAFATEVARRSWTAADSRNIMKMFNPMTLDALSNYAPEIYWKVLLDALDVENPGTMIIAQNTARCAIAALNAATPLSTLKAWQSFRMANRASPGLSKRFVDNPHSFYGTLSGTSACPNAGSVARRLLMGRWVNLSAKHTSPDMPRG